MDGEKWSRVIISIVCTALMYKFYNDLRTVKKKFFFYVYVY